MPPPHRPPGPPAISVHNTTRPPARSRSCSLATRTRSPGCGPVAEIAALIDAGELGLDISERELLREARRSTNAPRPATCAARRPDSGRAELWLGLQPHRLSTSTGIRHRSRDARVGELYGSDRPVHCLRRVADIGSDLHHSLSDVAWVLNAYALFFGALLVPAGRFRTNTGARTFSCLAWPSSRSPALRALSAPTCGY